MHAALTVLAAVAAFKWGLMLERQHEGTAKAKCGGKYKGRAPTAMRQAGELARLHAARVTPTETAKWLGLSRIRVYNQRLHSVATECNLSSRNASSALSERRTPTGHDGKAQHAVFLPARRIASAVAGSFRR